MRLGRESDTAPPTRGEVLIASSGGAGRVPQPLGAQPHFRRRWFATPIAEVRCTVRLAAPKRKRPGEDESSPGRSQIRLWSKCGPTLATKAAQKKCTQCAESRPRFVDHRKRRGSNRICHNREFFARISGGSSV